ncbi:hypothetical protein F4782DRAFT_512758 [Xylaria castorea]|nr:hypothetical protein F4782DRAFT_512758 [Xylaria castorea]
MSYRSVSLLFYFFVYAINIAISSPGYAYIHSVYSFKEVYLPELLRLCNSFTGVRYSPFRRLLAHSLARASGSTTCAVSVLVGRIRFLIP